MQLPGEKQFVELFLLQSTSVIDGAKFASHAYCQEELLAEFGVAFLCGICGIAPQTLDNSSAYIARWVERLQKDTTLVIKAATQAQRAVDFILGKTQVGDSNA